jgi:tyrosyl-DNA phosphodiesterase-1
MSDSETASEDELTEPAAKRIRLDRNDDENDETDSASSRPITPPPLRRGVVPVASEDVTTCSTATTAKDQELVIVTSPFQLTKIRDTQDHNNVDTITLGDILGDPLIKEMWQFNFLIDIDFTMYVHSTVTS